MDRKEIIILTVVLVFVGVRLYQKYVKKNQPNSRTKGPASSMPPSSAGDDDYEPYLKK